MTDAERKRYLAIRATKRRQEIAQPKENRPRQTPRFGFESLGHGGYRRMLVSGQE